VNTTVDLSPYFLRDLINRLRDQLEGDLAVILDQGAAGPESSRHRIASVVEEVEATIEGLQSDTPWMEPTSVAELHYVVDLVDRWKRTLEWSRLRRLLIHEQGYSHAVITMTMVEYFRWSGNQVLLVDETAAKGRPADMHLHVGGGPVQVEVK